LPPLRPSLLRYVRMLRFNFAVVRYPNSRALEPAAASARCAFLKARTRLTFYFTSLIVYSSTRPSTLHFHAYTLPRDLASFRQSVTSLSPILTAERNAARSTVLPRFLRFLRGSVRYPSERLRDGENLLKDAGLSLESSLHSTGSRISPRRDTASCQASQQGGTCQCLVDCAGRPKFSQFPVSSTSPGTCENHAARSTV
jgi:hypothetical protein